jgi:hypothetical protein
MKFNHSSAKSPCPCCKRTKDDKCRWNDEFLFCYFGDLFHPPVNLVAGAVIELGGLSWKMLRRNGGFAGQSAVFCRSEKFDKAKEAFIDYKRHGLSSAVSLYRLFYDKFFAARKQVKEIYGQKLFELMTLAELEQSSILHATCLDSIASAILASYSIYIKDSAIRSKRIALVRWEREVGYQASAQRAFESALGICR